MMAKGPQKADDMQTEPDGMEPDDEMEADDQVGADPMCERHEGRRIRVKKTTT